MYKSIIKPFFDFFAAFVGLIVLSPILLILILCLVIANNGKPFFLQPRPGKNERIFKIIKFKTMNDKTDKNGDLLPGEQRITKIGAFIRKNSLDEIPQLINVLKGDMSLIGPRPLLVRYLPRYSETQRQRHNVKPGITGWAQVNGRNALDWVTKFEHDVWYVQNQSFKLDLEILFKTLKKIVVKEGIYSNDNEIPPDFMGEH